MNVIAIIALFLIILILIVSQHLQSKEWQRERNDLYDRIMSKDLSEYKHETEPVKTYKPVDYTEEEEYHREQEARKR